MRLSEKIKLYSALIVLEEELKNGTYIPWYGICAAVNDKHVDQAFLQEVMSKWPKFSGYAAHPIKLGNEHPKLTYERFMEKHDNLWVGDYGKLRKELLRFAINYLAKDVEKNNGLK